MGMFTMVDKAINPDHYRRGGIEVVDVVRAFELNWALGTVTRYVLRCGTKNETPNQDLKKAVWYLLNELRAIGDADIEEIDTIVRGAVAASTVDHMSAHRIADFIGLRVE